MKRSILIPTLCAGVGFAFMTGASRAATIVLNDTATYTNTGIKQTSRTVTLAQIDDGSDSDDFVLTGTDKLVVALKYEGEGSGRTVTSITYNGQAMTEAIFDLSNVASGGTNQALGIFYLDNPTGEGDLTIEFSGNTNGLGVSFWALSNTLAGGPAATSAADGDGLSADISVEAGNTFIAAAHVANNGAATALAPLTSTMTNSNVGSARGGSGYLNYDGAADTIELDFDGGNSRPVTISAGFAVVPEPGSLALVTVSSLCVLRRRR
ncbi:MAG: PEP-CTERM sorting domain-containing protein [Planctomycetota bacterium]